MSQLYERMSSTFPGGEALKADSIGRSETLYSDMLWTSYIVLILIVL